MASERADTARLVAVCGVDAPSAPLVRATAHAAREQGLRVVVVIADEVDVLTASAEAPWLVLAQTAAIALGGGLPVAGRAGSADARAAAVLCQVEAALVDPGVDLVVLDAGDQRSARDLLAHPSTVVAAIGSLLGPDLAMRSTAADDSGFARLTAARDHAQRQRDLLAGASAVWRLAVAPRADTVPSAVRALAALVVLGARIDGLVLDGYPRKHDGDERRDSAAAARAVLEQASGTSVWRGGPDRRAVPKGSSVTGPVGPVAMIAPGDPVGDDHAWEWTITMPQAVAALAHVGIEGDRLVVEAAGSYRWLELPAVLRRTVAFEAVRIAEGLVVGFRTDPAVWRSTAGDEGKQAGEELT